jgi:hypothetical protein
MDVENSSARSASDSAWNFPSIFSAFIRGNVAVQEDYRTTFIVKAGQEGATITSLRKC